MSYQKELEALEEFKTLSSDVEKWRWLIKNQGRGLIVNLDNDDTFLAIKYDEERGDPPDYRVGQFSSYIGWSDGAFSILEAIGIEAEGV